MYYLNLIIIYSIFGFILESEVFKIKKLNKHSGALFGPISLVYSIGIFILEIIDKYLYTKIKTNKFLRFIIIFIVTSIVLTSVEAIIGYLGNLVLNIDIWNYENKKYNIGKYICLELIPIWGILGTLYLYYIKKFTDKIIKLIPKAFTKISTALLIIDIIIRIYLK